MMTLTRFTRLVPIVAALAVTPRLAFAVELDLVNDAFGDRGTAAFQQGFVTNEAAEVTLGPLSDTFTLLAIEFLYGPEDADTPVRVEIYRDEGVAEPGTLLYSADYSVQPAENVLHQIDLSGEDIVHDGAGSLRVALVALHDGAPSVARDDDGCQPGRNWIRTTAPTAWTDACDLGVPGDWIIRAKVDGPPPNEGGGGAGGAGGEAGASPGGGPSEGGSGAQGGGSVGGGGGVGGDGVDGGGCDCRSGVAAPSGGFSSLLGLAALLGLARRRRALGRVEVDR
jgi:MYXO-CTERM domain-containing protein